MNHYARLGVSPSATDADIRRAYRQMARRLHPDANPTDPQANERFAELSEAYRILSDPTLRARYDDWYFRGIAAATPPPPPRPVYRPKARPRPPYKWLIISGAGVAFMVLLLLLGLNLWDKKRLETTWKAVQLSVIDGDTLTSIRLLNEVLLLEENNPQALRLRGLLLLDLQNNAQAQHDLMAALRAGLDDDDLLQGLMTVHYRLRQYPQALLLTQKMLQRHPDDPNALLQQGVLYWLQADTLRACANWQQALLRGSLTADSLSRRHCH